VPNRNSSPYNTFAMYRTVDALVKLAEEARATNQYDMPTLESRAKVYLGEAQRQVEDVLKRNVFLTAGGAS